MRRNCWLSWTTYCQCSQWDHRTRLADLLSLVWWHCLSDFHAEGFRLTLVLLCSYPQIFSFARAAEFSFSVWAYRSLTHTNLPHGWAKEPVLRMCQATLAVLSQNWNNVCNKQYQVSAFSMGYEKKSAHRKSSLPADIEFFVLKEHLVEQLAVCEASLSSASLRLLLCSHAVSSSVLTWLGLYTSWNLSVFDKRWPWNSYLKGRFSSV